MSQSSDERKKGNVSHFLIQGPNCWRLRVLADQVGLPFCSHFELATWWHLPWEEGRQNRLWGWEGQAACGLDMQNSGHLRTMEVNWGLLLDPWRILHCSNWETVLRSPPNSSRTVLWPCLCVMNHSASSLPRCPVPTFTFSTEREISSTIQSWNSFLCLSYHCLPSWLFCQPRPLSDVP